MDPGCGLPPAMTSNAVQSARMDKETKMNNETIENNVEKPSEHDSESAETTGNETTGNETDVEEIVEENSENDEINDNDMDDWVQNEQSKQKESVVAKDVTSDYVDEDEELKEAIKKIREPEKKKASPAKMLLMIAIVIATPWLIYTDREDIAYFFSSRSPEDLGFSADYRQAAPDENFLPKPENFKDNSFVSVTGLPVRMVSMEVPKRSITGQKIEKKILYQLNGSRFFVEESLNGSRFAQFFSSTENAFQQNGLEPITVQGRLRRFDEDKNGHYASVREFFSSKYGMHFCSDFSQADLAVARSVLGRGGIIMQKSPSASVPAEVSSGTSASLNKIQVLQGTHAYIMGNNDTFLKTYDAGMTWTPVQLNLKKNARAFAFDSTGQRGAIGGSNGFIATTTEGPAKFLPVNGFFQQDVLDLAYLENQTLIAVGKESLLAISEDAGQTWKPGLIKNNIDYNAIIRTQKNHYVAVGSNKIILHSDDGEHWVKAVSPVNTDYLSLSAGSLDENGGQEIIATGKGGAVIRSTDEGKTWKTWNVDLTPGIEFNMPLQASAFDETGKIWIAVGNRGTIVRAENGDVQPIAGSYAGNGLIRRMIENHSLAAALGETASAHTDAHLYDVSWAGKTVYAVGEKALIMVSTDQGKTWTKRKLPSTDVSLKAVLFISETTGYIAGEKGFLAVTKDGGQNWKKIDSRTERTIEKLYAGNGIKGGIIYAGSQGLWGYCRDNEKGCFLRSKTFDHYYKDVALLDSQFNDFTNIRLLAVGTKNHIDKVDENVADSNEKYIPQYLEPLRKIRAMDVADEPIPFSPVNPKGQLALAVGENGIVSRSYNAGLSFSDEASGTDETLNDVKIFSDNMAAAIAGNKGFLAVDATGNGVWQRIALENEDNVLSLLFQENQLLALTDHDIFSIGMDKRSEGEFPVRKLFHSDAQLLRFGLKNGLYAVSSAEGQGADLLHLTETDNGEYNGQIAWHSDEPIDNLTICGDKLFFTQNKQLKTFDSDKIVESVDLPENALALQCSAQQLLVTTAGHNAFIRVADTWQSDATFSSPGNVANDAIMYRSSTGRWWLADNHFYMSKDGTGWSFRRDRITDFHAIATGNEQQMVVAVGDNGTLLVSGDAGKTWSKSETSEKHSLRGVCISKDGKFALAVGDGGAMLRSTSMGARWSKIQFDSAVDLTDCQVLEGNGEPKVLVVGRKGVMYITDDLKITQFNLVTHDCFEDLRSVAEFSTGDWLVAGGERQDPSSICQNGTIIVADEAPSDHWLKMLFYLGMILLSLYNIRAIVQSLKISKQGDDEDDEDDDDV